MQPKSCKAKGRRLQQLLVSDLLQSFPDLTGDDVASTPMGCPGADVRLSQAAKERIPFCFEAKNCERVNVWAAIEQARRNAAAGQVPCVVIKKNHAEPHAVLPWKTLLALIDRQQ